MISDLELRVTLKDDERTLAFELNSAVPELAFYRTPVGSVRLSATPRQQLDALFDDLSRLAQQRADRRSTLEQAEVSDRLAGIGQRLYRDLFPEELKRAYHKIRKLERNHPLTLLITSDEPWIPWELVKPYERVAETDEAIDDSFFCERFYLTRWLAGIAPPQLREVGTLAVVVPRSNLAYTQREIDYFAELAERARSARVLPTLGSMSAVKAELRDGAAQLWHFACHGNFASDDPDASAVHLEGGVLRAEDIVGPVESGIGKSRPVCTLNACDTGRQGFALTGLGGWARQLIRAGASAFIGSQWAAHDQLAAEFAIAFYEGLWAGAPLGQAAHAARMTIKAMDATNPTWLTYGIYGHPGLRVWLKGQAEPEQEAAATVVMRPLPPRPEEQPVPVTNHAATRSEPVVSSIPVRPVEPLPDGFVYDAFISYRHEEPDESWVQNTLVPALEQAGLRICLDVRDFDPGVPEYNERARAVEQSRRTIAVLSTRYVQNNLAELENLMAQTLGVEAGQYRLLPVRIDKDCQVPLRLRIYWFADFADPARRKESINRLIEAVRQLPIRR